MDSLVSLGLVQYSPVSAVVPFTYRDNATYLQILRALECKLDDIVDQVNLSITQDNDNLNNGLSGLRDQVLAIRQELIDLIAGSHDESVANDPTNGNRLSGLSTVVGHVYDNLRIYGWFAKQYDNLNYSAAAYDALQLSARHFDLAATYPTLNDVQL